MVATGRNGVNTQWAEVISQNCGGRLKWIYCPCLLVCLPSLDGHSVVPRSYYNSFLWPPIVGGQESWIWETFAALLNFNSQVMV